jgi:hypothetical protein
VRIVKAAPRSVGADDRDTRRPWYRRRAALVLAGVVLPVVAGGAFVAYRWSQRGASEASAKEAIARYRREAGASADAGFLRPAGGVYNYQAKGTDKISILGTSQQWGPSMPGTVVEQAGDCWTLRIDYNTNHWQEQRYCASRRGLLDLGQRIFQSFDFGVTQVGDTNVITCDPPGETIRVDAEPGDWWRQSCTGHNADGDTKVTSTGTNRFLGIEKLRIDGETVPALHYRQRRTLSGDQEGSEDTHIWFGIVDGMVLRSTHDTRVTSPSPIGDVVYTEQGEFRLTSRKPRR